MKFNDKSQSPQESRVNALFPLGRDNHYAFILINLLEQIVYFQICEAIVAVLDVGALSKQCISFVKEQDRIVLLGRRKNLPKILFRLAVVLADNLAQVDVIDILSQFFRQRLRRRCFFSMIRAGEQHTDAVGSL